MKIERPNCNLSPDELTDLERLRALIERAIADGRLTQQEMASIKASIATDGKVTFEELELCQELIWDKIKQGELEYLW
jgi:uncharacterized membrane protein YebE (DUF533 family)